MRFFLAALMVWALLFSGTCCRSAKVQRPGSRDTEEEAMAPVTVTNDSPVASFPVPPEKLANAPQILEVPVTRVLNPDKIPVTVFVYFSATEKKGRPKAEDIPIGNFSLYPPDQPGKFLLSLSTAMAKLKEQNAASRPNEFRLTVQLKRLNEAQPWTSVALTISPPRWLKDESK